MTIFLLKEYTIGVFLISSLQSNVKLPFAPGGHHQDGKYALFVSVSGVIMSHQSQDTVSEFMSQGTKD